MFRRCKRLRLKNLLELVWNGRYIPSNRKMALRSAPLVLSFMLLPIIFYLILSFSVTFLYCYPYYTTTTNKINFCFDSFGQRYCRFVLLPIELYDHRVTAHQLLNRTAPFYASSYFMRSKIAHFKWCWILYVDLQLRFITVKKL